MGKKKFKNTQQINLKDAVKDPLINREKISVVFMLFLAVCSILVYSNTFHGKFIWDDNILIRDNYEIRSWSNIKKVLLGNLGGENLYYQHSSYRPLQTISYMVDYYVGGLNPFFYRFQNIVLHALVGVSLYWVFFILFGSNILCIFSTLLYIVHPINTEAVAYIAGRADPLSSLFMLLSIGCYFYFDNKKGNVYTYLLTMACYIFGILSRENALMMPFFILIYHFSFKTKIYWKKMIGFIVLAGVYIFLRQERILGNMAMTEVVKTTIIERIPGFFVALTMYFKLLIWPFDLHMEYGRPVFEFTQIETIIGMFIFIVLVFGIFYFKNKKPIIVFGLLWFLVGLLPVSNVFVIVNAFMAEHWLYFPAMGLFLIIGYCAQNLYIQSQWRGSVLIIMFLLAAFYSYRTFEQNKTWLNPIAFFERTLSYASDSARLYADLGEAYFRENRKEDSLRVTLKAVELKPDYYAAYSNLGTIFSTLGKQKEAMMAYEKAVEVNPGYFNALFNLANGYISMGDYKKGIEYLEKSIFYRPNFANAYNNLGIVYNRIGQKEKAIGYYEKAIAINPMDIRFYNNMASNYSDLGNPKKAIEIYTKALSLNIMSRDTPIIYYNLSLAYTKANDSANAKLAFDTGNSFDLGASDSYKQLSEIFNKAGLTNQAQILLQKAAQIEKVKTP